MTDSLVAFLRARLDEAAAKAQAAKPGPWHVDGGSVYATHPTDEVVDYTESADHIARHDPARILREIEADRALLAEYEAVADMDTSDPEPEFAYGRAVGLGIAVRYRAVRFADHPDYREKWRP